MRCKKLTFIYSVGVVAILFFINTPSTNAAKCFEDIRVDGSQEAYSNTTFIGQSPSCSSAMGEAGYDTTGLPKPFPSSNNICYYFPDSGGNNVVDCKDSRFVNAPAYGQQPDGSSNKQGELAIKDDPSSEPRSTAKADDIYTKILNPAILALSAAVVLAVVGSIVVAGVQYSTANGNSSAVASAKNRIVISILVLILYTFGFAILQWLIPGGIGS